jgi:uncharacterized YccA/Bax inhibitor family protein
MANPFMESKVYSQIKKDAGDTENMTLSGTVNKTILLLAITIASAI